jgi:type II secretory pathway pseudopilin PulG
MKKTTQKGFSTLEIVIAFAVMTLSMTAIIMVAFGNQSSAIDTELAQRGLYVAQKKLEEAAASLLTDFGSVQSEAAAISFDSIYDTQIEVNDISPCVKELESTSFWDRDTRDLQTSLTSLLVSPKESLALGNDCKTEKTKKIWDNPVSFAFSDPIDAGNQGTAVDTVEHGSKNYAILTTKWKNNKNTLWVIDATNPGDPEAVAGIEALDKLDFTDVDAYHLESSNFIYAFVASASTTAQMQVYQIDITNPAAVTMIKVAQVKLPQLTNGVGRTIYYYDNKVYIGTQYVACVGTCSAAQNNEFHIYDVTTPATPTWQGSVNVNHNINDIAVLGDWAYLALSDDTRELAVIQINSTKANYLTHHDTTGFGYNAAGTTDALTLAVSGQYVFVGRGQSSSPELFALKASDLRNGTSVTDGALSSINLEGVNCTYKSGTIKSKACISSGKLLKDIALDGDLAFLVTTEGNAEFQVWDISNISDIKPKTKCNSYEFPAKPVAIDFSGDYGYVAVESNDAFRVMYDNNAQVCMP